MRGPVHRTLRSSGLRRTARSSERFGLAQSVAPLVSARLPTTGSRRDENLQLGIPCCRCGAGSPGPADHLRRSGISLRRSSAASGTADYVPASFRERTSVRPATRGPLLDGHHRRWRHRAAGARTRPQPGRARTPGPGAGRSDHRSRRRVGRVFVLALAGGAPLHVARGADGGRRSLRGQTSVPGDQGDARVPGARNDRTVRPGCDFGGEGVRGGCRPRGMRAAGDRHRRLGHWASRRRLNGQHLPAADHGTPADGHGLATGAWAAGPGTRLAGPQGGSVAAGPHPAQGQRGAGRAWTAIAEGAVRTA